MVSWEVLGGARVIVEWPTLDVDDLVAAGEVALQEGCRAWSLDVADLALLAQLRTIFARRAVIGVRGVRVPSQAKAAHEAGADFGLCPVTTRGLLTHTALPLALGALTPNEIVAAAAKGGAVQVIPADALGTAYSRSLPAMFPDVALIATGRLERFMVDLWLDAGAAAVVPQTLLPADTLTDPDLSDLRSRLQGIADA